MRLVWLLITVVPLPLALEAIPLQITEAFLKGSLSDGEKSFLLGFSDSRTEYAVVHPKFHTRKKRSAAFNENFYMTLEAKSLGRTFKLRLRRSPPLLDSNFVLMERWFNDSKILSTESADNNCCYLSEHAALTLCGGIRGFIKTDNDKFYTIHPLPKRFHNSEVSPHLIVRRSIPPRYAHLQNRFRRNKQTNISNETLKSNQDAYKNDNRTVRVRRETISPGVPIYVETAVFIDKDLFQHMEVNYPVHTEREIVRFVLAMINAVQLLYHDESLGRTVNFVLKRMEILHDEPSGLQRSHDIDQFLSSFCNWQQTLNPALDTDPAHWDHALILTGLDLYVVGKHGKISSQVVGLAPVAGMCTSTNSCTVNEGRHFESVYVVAHEIGHNLGMRHDGPLADNDCDPSSFIMSPTLGSGKITWSPCSKRYLQMFLETIQSRCLLDHGSSAGKLDHGAEGVLPGERFDADQQCMLKYGPGSRHSLQQPLDDICRDLHCQRDRYTWTSHPALEGTQCGFNMWCRSGNCLAISKVKVNEDVKNRGWSPWFTINECASGCLYGEEGRLKSGSVGITIATRKCHSSGRPENGERDCVGPDTRYQVCNAIQCLNVPRMTISEFADQICERAKLVDNELTGTGLQRVSSNADEACIIWCHKKRGGSKTRGWMFPDGTVCQKHQRRFGKPTYCIAGRCEEFTCGQHKNSQFINLPELCSNGKNDVTNQFRNNPRRRESGSQWVSASGCHSQCMSPGTGIRLVVTKGKQPTSSIQLCQPDKMSCGRLTTPFQYATNVCTNYKKHVSKLSGLGMQISSIIEDPDRSCRIACQDEKVTHRFYLVNGEEGWFPYGTECARGTSNKKAFCVSGKCLIFGSDDTPLIENEFTLPLFRIKRSVTYNVTKIIATLQQHELDQIIARLNQTFTKNVNVHEKNEAQNVSIDLDNPVFFPVNMELEFG